MCCLYKKTDTISKGNKMQVASSIQEKQRLHGLMGQTKDSMVECTERNDSPWRFKYFKVELLHFRKLALFALMKTL